MRSPRKFPKNPIHPNVLAGALVLIIPVGLVLVLWPPLPPRRRLAVVARLGVAALVLVMLGVVALTQARGAQ